MELPKPPGPDPAQWDTQSHPAASQQHQGHLGPKSPPGCAQEISSTVPLSECFSHHLHAAHSDKPLSTGSLSLPLGNPLDTAAPRLSLSSLPVACCTFSPSRILPYHPFLPRLPGQARCLPTHTLPWGAALPAALVLQVCQPPIRSPCSKLSMRHFQSFPHFSHPQWFPADGQTAQVLPQV